MSLLFLPTIPAAASSATHDPYWANVVNLFHFDNNLTNSKSGGPTVSAYGTAATSATQSKFGGYSLNLPNTTSGVQSSSAPALQIGTADFTDEFWVYMSNVTTAQNIYDRRPSSTPNTPDPTIYVTGGTVRLFVSNADRITSGAAAITTNTWTAIALSRNSGVGRLFVNGSQVGSNYTWVGTGASQIFTITTENGVSGVNSGYVDELRTTIGVGRYASNYTVQTAAWPNG